MKKEEIMQWAATPEASVPSEYKVQFVVDSIAKELRERRAAAIETIAIIDESLVGEYQTEESALQLSVRELGLRSMGSNALYRSGIETVEDVIQKTPNDLRRVYRFGKGAYEELITKLDALNLRLKEPDSQF